MQFIKLLFPLIGISFFAPSFAQKPLETNQANSSIVEGHPAWILQGNIYEVNVRQYTPEGTFKAFAKNLDRLKAMGVQTLWFMPINPISKINRKGSLGSYYAVSSYTAINPEFGTLNDWKALVKQCHEKGFKVIIDWVPNHTGADHYWLQKHPDFYEKDSTGQPAMAADWVDTKKLDYSNSELRDTMINQMLFWIKRTGIDGFRCDVATGLPDDFWKRCIIALRKEKNIFMLAEGDKPALNADGFDATYTWNDFVLFKKIAKGERKASDFDSALNKTDKEFTKNALRMFFTSNHDENSWNEADFNTTPGASYAPFAVMTQTVKRSVPLIYGGQEEPFMRAIRFFDKDTITFGKYGRADFYKKLLALRKSNPALAANADFVRIPTNADDKVYAYVRENKGRKVFVVLNWTTSPVNVQVDNALVVGNAIEIFSGKKVSLRQKEEYTLKPWGYQVYDYK